MQSNLDTSLFDVILAALHGLQEEMHTALPGQVTAYDPVTQLADVQPMLKKPTFDDNDNRIDPVSFPVLPKVPVRWPQAGGFAFVLPMQVGDYVWVEFSEYGTGEFRSTGQESEPFDIARHTITYPYCSPAAPPDTHAMTDATVTAGTDAILGKLGSTRQIVIKATGGVEICLGGPSPADFVALAAKVDANFAAINTFLGTLFGPPSKIVAPAGTAGGPCTITGATGVSFSSSASTKVACE